MFFGAPGEVSDDARLQTLANESPINNCQSQAYLVEVSRDNLATNKPFNNFATKHPGMICDEAPTNESLATNKQPNFLATKHSGVIYNHMNS